MLSDKIKIGDKLQLKAGFLSNQSRALPVTITDKRAGNAEGGYVFYTEPVYGSGYGICAAWFEPFAENEGDLSNV